MGAPLLDYAHLGRRPYQEVLELQLSLARLLSQGVGEVRDTLLTVEHDPVITIGRKGSDQDILISAETRRQLGVEVHHVDRGGQVTFHGPGQLVVYPILKVDSRRMGVVDLVRGLAASLVDLLAEFGVDARYDPERPGLWVGQSKIGAIGMRVTQGVSFHGAALNVTNDLEPFRWIVPCGQPHCRVTNLVEQLAHPDRPMGLDLLSNRLAALFARRFGYDLVDADDRIGARAVQDGQRAGK